MYKYDILQDSLPPMKGVRQFPVPANFTPKWPQMSGLATTRHTCYQSDTSGFQNWTPC